MTNTSRLSAAMNSGNRKTLRREIDRWVGDSTVPMSAAQVEAVRNVIKMRHSEAMQTVPLGYSIGALFLSVLAIMLSITGSAGPFWVYFVATGITLLAAILSWWPARRVTEEANRLTKLEAAYLIRGLPVRSRRIYRRKKRW